MQRNGRIRDTQLERAIEESLYVKGVEAHLDGETITLRRPGRDSARLSNDLQQGLVQLEELWDQLERLETR